MVAAVVGAGLGVAGTHLFPRDSWSLGKISARPWKRVEVTRVAGTARVAYEGGWCSRYGHDYRLHGLRFQTCTRMLAIVGVSNPPP